MACGGCNTSTGLTKEQVENLINKLIDEGKISAGLNACDGSALSKGAKLVLCDQLAEKVNDLMKDGLIRVVTQVEYKDGKLIVTDADGRKHETDMPFVKGVEVAGKIQLTLPNGKEVIIPTDAMSEGALGKTIKKGILAEGKYDVDVAELAGKGLKKDDNGKLAVDPSTLTNENTGPNNAYTNAGSGLANDGQGGLKVVPADFIDNDTIIVDPNTGRIKVKPKTCVDVTNGNLNTLSNGLSVLGQTCFYGRVVGRSDLTSNEFIVGVPADPTNDSLMHTTAAENKEQFIFGAADITGYQIASPNEVIQYFYDDYTGREAEGLNKIQNTGWVRIYSGGLNPDGTMKPGSWTRWERNGAIPDPDGGLSALANRVKALEDARNQPCRMKVITKGTQYYATVNDDMIIMTGSQSVHFDDATVGSQNIGKQWTVVNADEGTTILASSGTIVPPYKGSVKVKGTNAVVTVVKTDVNHYRVFGQTEPSA